ncbi:cilia- and flagella-associated protein 36 [Anopheles cruzii]|uniref:cilia- and flagella-associated protein 36 n=1 Tax=Anopheles cruzii TaxID=68878 RepID=UPI0022EC4DE2|nr:cilia- and flagella-associated protein 36 [Anopheles cruzii]
MTEDNSWVFDSLVCFLHGPVWNAPLQTFIEDKSIIFDPSLQPDETNPEFRKVYDEYKNLVDWMLGSFMEEMQITPEQFEFACLEGRHVANLTASASASTIEDTSASADDRAGASTFSFHQGLFQQIWAANDIRIFIRMMVQRNVELQLQALDLIERRSQGSSVGHDTHAQSGGSLDGETSDAGPSHSRMLNNSELEETEGTHSEGELERDIIKSMENELNKPDGATTNVLPLLAEQVKNSVSSLKEVPEETDKFQRLNLFFDQEKINAEDMKSRQEYLRAQRDKILHIKKKARARQLNETIRKNDRPNSAQVAQKILDGDTETVPVEPPEGSLQLRKMLAQRLRDEIAGEKE